MVPGISDSDRRSEIAERTRMGLEEDLEDLRSDLRADLGRYEGRIREVAQRAPRWTSVNPTNVVDLFKIDVEELPEQGFLGPRMVAIAADAADGFVDKWMAVESDLEGLEERLDEFERDVRELLVFLEGIEGCTGRRADRAHRILEEWMEANLAHLDELRENDLEALQDLVGEGALETGPDAREEKAQLWEEQRKRADELREIWDEFHDLVDEGLDYTEGGIWEVVSLVRRACEGLEGAHPALYESRIVAELFAPMERDPSDGSEEGTAIGGRADTQEAPGRYEGTSESGGERAAPSGEEGSRDRWLRRSPTAVENSESGAGIETELLDDRDAEPHEAEGDGSASGPATEPMLQDETSEEAAENADGAEVSETEPSLGSSRADEDGASAESAAASADRDSAGASNESPSMDSPAPAAPGPVAPEDAESDARNGGEVEGGDRRQFEAPAPEPEERSPETLESAEATCLRIRTQWRKVGAAALAAALGPPAGFLVAMVGLSFAHLLGVRAAFNPVIEWSWAEPAIGVALIWCLCTPMLLGWRPRWSGWRFQFVQEVELREEASFEMSEAELSLGRVSFKWSALESYRLRRWEAPDGEMFGWLLIVDPEYYEPIQIIAAEDDREYWEDSSRAVVEAPRDAWQLEQSALKRLLSELARGGVDAIHFSSDADSEAAPSTKAAPSGASK